MCSDQTPPKPVKCKKEINPVIGLRWFKRESLMLILYKDGTKKYVNQDPKII